MATAPSEPVTAGTGERTPLPAEGTSAAELRRVMEEAAGGDLDWLRRMATGTNYPAGDDVLEVAKEAYLRFFSTNGLLPGTFPSLARFEREVDRLRGRACSTAPRRSGASPPAAPNRS